MAQSATIIYITLICYHYKIYVCYTVLKKKILVSKFVFVLVFQLSRVMKEPAFCIGENQGADQIMCSDCDRAAGQLHVHAKYTIPLLS